MSRHPDHAVATVATKKRKKTRESTAVQPPDGGNHTTTEDTATTIGRLRQQIAKWQRGMSKESLRTLQENVNYELTVKEENVMVSCKLCCRNVSLSSKHNKLILSNWTRHISTCFKRPKEHNY